MIMVSPADSGEEEFSFISFTISIRVNEHKNVRRVGDDYFVSQNTNAERCVDAGVLVENSFLVSATIPVCILQNHDPIPFRLERAPFLKTGAIIHAFSHPDASPLVYV